MPAALSVGWIFLVTILYFLPSLLHGTILGPQDILARYPLTEITGVVPYNGTSSNQITAFLPWSDLDWRAIHSGHLPLWNPYSGLGLPLLGNFQSAPFSLPALISYLGPLRYSYTIQVLARMVIGGTGVLWMGRRSGLSYLASTTGATTFMLSGAFVGWIGWPMAGTMAWLGWAMGAMILAIRCPERRGLYVAGLALSIAFMFYGGHPESAVMVLICLALVCIVLLSHHAIRHGIPSILRPASAVGAGTLGGTALAAPLLLPGLQILRLSAHQELLPHGLPSKAAINLLVAGYWGFPTHGSLWFGPSNYYETAAYIGAVGLVLAGLAVFVKRTDPIVVGVAFTALVAFVVTYSSRADSLLASVPSLRPIAWNRMAIALDFLVAILVAFGCQVLIDRSREATVRRGFTALTLLAAAATGLLWFHHLSSPIPGQDRRIQLHSLIWPTAAAAILLAIAGMLNFGGFPSRHGHHRQPLQQRSGRRLVTILSVTQLAFLLTATPRLWASSSTYFPATPAISTLKADIGTNRIGFVSCATTGLPGLGILAEANDAYAIAEATTEDPSIPKSYFSAYYKETGQADGPIGNSIFCPAVANAAMARHFGISFVFASPGTPPPPGDTLRAVIAGESLFHVPDAGLLTMQPAGSSPDQPDATVLQNTSSNPSEVRASLDARAKSTVYIHITDLPGWKATIDGHPIPIHRWGGTMLALSVPAGHHQLTLTYLPASFKIGVALGSLAAILLLAEGITVWRRSSRSPA